MEATALIIFFILSWILFCLLTKSQLNYTVRNLSVGPLFKKKSVILSMIGMILLGILAYYLIVATDVCSLWYIAVSIIISLSLILIFYHRSKKYSELPRSYRLNSIMIAFAMSAVLNVGVIFFCRWFFPDITVVNKEEGRYNVSTSYALPFTSGLKPTYSYIGNDTEDTLYRVVVSYAFLGEEVNNHYNVTDTIIPMTTVRIPCPPNYVTRSIFPVMMPSSGRTGRVRARRSYIATKSALNAFETGDFRCLGIKANIRINSFNITTNPIIREDPERLRVLEQTIDRIIPDYNHNQE